MSLVVVATTEHAPFGDGGSDDRRRQKPRGSGGDDLGEEGAAERGGRQYLQPHESQLATFVEIPSAGPAGQCAHYICPITVRVAFLRCNGPSSRVALCCIPVHDCLTAQYDVVVLEQAQRMTDPVCDKDGHAYERTAILQRLANGAPVSPISKAPLTASDLTTDHPLKYATPTDLLQPPAHTTYILRVFQC